MGTLDALSAKQNQIAENVRRNILETKEAIDVSSKQFEESLRDRTTRQRALRRQGLVDVDPIGPATRLGSLDADRQRLDFIQEVKRAEEQLAL